MLDDFVRQFGQYRQLGERALAQIPDDALDRLPAPDGNSAAMIVRHVGGNLRSRFTDFLTSDGEKPWRDRDAEFEIRAWGRAAMDEWWRTGWSVLEDALAGLSDAELARTITIRAEPMTVHMALCRALAHTAYHVGQLVLLGRMAAGEGWETLTIPRGQSQAATDRMAARQAR